jgi:hypothetical protein
VSPRSLVALSLVALSCASAHGLRPLSETLPAGLPTAKMRADWERIDGDYETATEHVRYALFVDPERPLLFRITQYRVSPRRGVSAPRGEDGPEMVIWNATPGQTGPLRCFAEVLAPPVRRGTPPSWRDVDVSTEEFRANMSRALQIYGRVHHEGRAGPPVR